MLKAKYPNIEAERARANLSQEDLAKKTWGREKKLLYMAYKR